MVNGNEIEGAQRQIAYESALEGLDAIVHPNSVDLENAFDQLSDIKNPSLVEAKSILYLAARRSPLWSGAVDTDVILFGLSPSLEAYRAHVKTQDNPEAQDEYNQTVVQIAIGMVRSNPDALPRLMQFGYFEEDGVTMTGVLGELLPNYQNRGFIWDTDSDSGILPVMLDNVVNAQDPSLLAKLEPVFPLRLLEEPESTRLFPRVREVLEQVQAKKNATYIDMAREYIFYTDESKDVFKSKVRAGELGNPIEALTAGVDYLVSPNNSDGTEQERESAAYDLWAELLEITRTDPKTRPLREKLISREWYWDESIMYTLIDTVVGMEGDIENLDPRFDRQVFIEMHFTEIIEILRKTSEWKKYGKRIEDTISRGEFPKRLNAVLDEVLELSNGNMRNPYVEEFSNGLLLATLS